MSARTTAEKIAKLIYPEWVTATTMSGVIDTFEAIIDEHGQDEYDQAIEDYWDLIHHGPPQKSHRLTTRKA